MTEIKKIKTIRIKDRPNILWVELETAEGIVGLGETWRGASAVEGVIHDDIAPWLLGRDSRAIERISNVLLNPYVGFHSASAEVRAASAIDIALWDIFGKRHGIPVCEALGGASRDKVRVYNTCSGYSFNAKSSSYDTASTRRTIKKGEKPAGPYDDQVAFMTDAGKLAKNLLAEGYTAMKIWPFDMWATGSYGCDITDEGIERGMDAFRKIRDAVGGKMQIMCEMHSIWKLPAALKICRALEEVGVFWAEDCLCKMDDKQALRELRSKTSTPICGSETLSGMTSFREMISEGAFDYVMLDTGWCGGLSEGRKIAALADSFCKPFAPHDCTGPVQLWAGLHLAAHASNALFQEVVRANLASWYKDLVTELPQISDGYAAVPTAPGIGTELRPEVYTRPDAVVRVSE
ncbi:MAG TPA: mandelate racemase/muconate lactonizing enzyme family protein [Firmicutes bacterium]|nr:mandelate racemase/muconate lactonizing enzyme family protein [Bacillota bacterium]